MNKFLTLIPLYLISIACNRAIAQPTPTVAPKLQTTANSTISPESIARQITVKVHVGDRRGSGTLIAKRGHRYTILTNAHVANKSNTYRITTPDGKTYPARCAQPLKQGTCIAAENQDLALLEFTSTQNYTVPTWGDSRSLKLGETVYSAGFPFEQQELKIDTSQISQQTAKPLQGGYQIGFSNTTVQGMSGGSLLNSSGQLIGIIGFNAQPIFNDGYQYQDGSQPTANEIRELRKSSFAIPIATLAKSDRQYQTVLPKQTTTTIAPTNYTGVVKQVDEIAQQITVRIEDKNGGNGSGVIIAKEGDTYYVATAAHVAQTNDGEKIAVVLITPTQEQIGLQAGDINVVNKDLGVVIVKFKSKQNYRITEIGKYDLQNNQWVFVSGFPDKDTSNQRHLSIGMAKNREETDFAVKDRGSLAGGNNLIYTNLSLHGMSGGAVLDRLGRLVGINTGAENEYILSTKEEINFGFALGIPIATVIGVFSQGQIPAAQLQVTNTPAPESSQSEDEEIRRIQLSTLSKPSQTATAKEWLDYANLLWRSAKKQEAVAAFETAIKLLERHPEIQGSKEQLRTAYFGLGLVWWNGESQQDLQAAVVNLQKAEKVNPEFYQSSRYLGRSLNDLKRYPEALTAYQRAISTQKADFVLYVEQGNVLRQMKRYREAVSSYDLAIALQPKHPWAYNNRGIAYEDLKQYALEIADYTQAIQLNPQLHQAYYNRGHAYQIQEKNTQAIADYTQAIQLNPQFYQAYNNRGHAYYDLKKYDRAIADYNQSIKLNPQLYQAYYNRGNVYFDLKKYTQSLADYTQAIKLDPQDPKVYVLRGIAYSNQQKSAPAIADYTQAIKLNPQFAAVYVLRGNIYFEQQKYAQAIADYTQAIQLNPQDPRVYVFRGNAHSDQQKSAPAIADYTQAIKLNPQDPEVYNKRGLAFTKQKEYAQAISDHNQAIKLNPQFAAAYHLRAIAYGLQGKSAQAQANLAKAAELYRAQNNTADYQRVIELLQSLQKLP